MIVPVLIALLLNGIEFKEYDAKFKGCYDGDTCTFDLVLDDRSTQLGTGIMQRVITERQSQKVRLCDINAPEMKPGPNPAAIKARDDLIAAILAAKKLTVKVPQRSECKEIACDKFEKYGRLLVYIMADGVNLNEQQIANKNAVPYIRCD